MLILLALLLGPVLAALFLSFFGPAESGVARFRVLCVAVGAIVLVGIAVVRVTTDGPTTDGLLHLRHALILDEGLEETIPFDLRRTNSQGYEVELHLDASLPTERWKPLHSFGYSSQGRPPWGLQVDWTLHLDGRPRAPSQIGPTIRSSGSYTTDGPLVWLGRYRSLNRGRYEIRLRLERVPDALRGEEAHLVIDSDMIAYKTARGRRSARTMAHLLLGISAVVTLTLGLLAIRIRPREPRLTG